MAYKNFSSIDEQANQLQNNNRLIDRVCEHLALPDSTFLGTRITKKMLMDNNKLSSAEKKLVADVVQSTRWQNTLKPETINVPVYVTETVEYLEIAVMRVVLRNISKKNKSQHNGKLKPVAKLLHTLIPYPIILLLAREDNLVISLADKRINQADHSKLVIEHMYNSHWLNQAELTKNDNLFLNDFSLRNVSSLNYFELYQDFITMLIALETSKISGHYVSKNQINNQLVSQTFDLKEQGQSSTPDSLTFFNKSNEEKTATLSELKKLEAQRCELSNKLKKSNQMGTQVELNTQIKKINDEIATIKGSF